MWKLEEEMPAASSQQQATSSMGNVERKDEERRPTRRRGIEVKMKGGSNVVDEPLGPSGPDVTVPAIAIGNATGVDERWI
ncbi:hypothetical protein CSAL01_13303 [Colletotrichum salicis]|uniref:Uncharacterized protein n=1 Tax=Colletotrichum salicis TaxID=1209931 RepID=A0A135UMS3_9PEZI|nr:hypothetical protein CSAL01_13303 [Colletotrichum salicis]